MYIPKLTIFDVAKNAGLQVENSAGLPAKCDAFLDPHEKPNFIAVNRDLPHSEKLYAIARELGRCWHHQKVHSIVLDRPWKWQALAEAPDETKEKICKLDSAARAQLLMLFCTTGDEFRAYIKHDPKRFLPTFADNIAFFILLKIRINILLGRILRVLTIA